MTEIPHPAWAGDEDGCGWLIEVASGNPEPDSIEDTVLIIPCGAPVWTLEDDPTGDEGWRCAAGHQHLSYGSRRQQAEEQAEALCEHLRSGAW